MALCYRCGQRFDTIKSHTYYCDNCLPIIHSVGRPIKTEYYPTRVVYYFSKSDYMGALAFHRKQNKKNITMAIGPYESNGFQVLEHIYKHTNEAREKERKELAKSNEKRRFFEKVKSFIRNGTHLIPGRGTTLWSLEDEECWRIMQHIRAKNISNDSDFNLAMIIEEVQKNQNTKTAVPNL